MSGRPLFFCVFFSLRTQKKFKGRIRTVSGLAFLIFSAKFYKSENKPIYYIEGKIEEFIRKAYYGGIVDVNTNYTDYTTYKYDVNSHYPNSMLMPMPAFFYIYIKYNLIIELM